jgi:hypothetical protein
MAALAAGMRGNKGGQPQFMPPQQGGRSLLGVNPAGVSTLTSPKIGPMNNIKFANAIYDPLIWAARNRVANHVLNEVTKTNPLGMSEATKTTQENPKQLELVSKYPELEELLKDEQNKAYLNKLLGA